MSPTDLYNYLESTRVDTFKHFHTIGSTNDVALDWIDHGAADYSLVVADEQTRGRGRFDRRWISRPGSSLAFSLILRPTPEEMSRIPFFAPLCGLAVREALANSLSLNAEIKWPNDVLVNRRKCCGILVEASWTGGKLAGIVLGIGINVSPQSIPPAENQSFPATCLESETGCAVDRFSILREVILSIPRWRALLGSELFINSWQEHLAFKGETVRLEGSGKPATTGVLKGVDASGNLVLLSLDGTQTKFEVGDVHLRPGALPHSGAEHAG